MSHLTPSKAAHSNAIKIGSSWTAVGLIWLITLAVFWPTFNNGFQLEWDDQWMLLNHDLVLNPDWENIWYYLTHYVDGQYFPFNQIYYVVLFQVNGFDPMVYHLGSLLIHMLNASLVYVLLRQITKKIERPKKHTNLLVALTTLIFAIHPLQVEAVAWISASKVLLYTFFMLCSLILYLRYLDSGKYWYLLTVLLAYLLGFMCKEQMIILPLLLVLFDLFFVEAHISISRLVLEKALFFSIAAILWYFASRSGMGTLDVATYPWHQRVAMGSYCYFTYWFRFLAPIGLLHFYDYPIDVGEMLPSFYYLYILMFFLLSYCIMELWRKRARTVVFSLLFTIVSLALVLHIIPSPRTYMAADRFLYIPMIGMGLLVIWLMGLTWSRWPSVRPVYTMGFVATLLLFLGLISFDKTKKWRDSVSLKKEVREYLEQRNLIQ